MKLGNRLILTLLLCGTGWLWSAPIRVLYQADLRQDQLKSVDRGPATYLSALDLARILSCRYYQNNERQKIVLYLGDHRIKISANSSYVVVDETVYQMPGYALLLGEDIYVPALPFFSLLQQSVMPGLTYHGDRQLLSIDIVEFNITALSVDEKANGIIIRLDTKGRFPDGNISSFVHENGWFYITVAGGVADTTGLRRTNLGGAIRQVLVDQLQESAQLAFRLRSKVENHEVYQGNNPNQIVITLRTPMDRSLARLENVRERWYLDKVVLDAGHGGKDIGTRGRQGTKEKEIVLDITKRVGGLLRKRTGIEVFYTRDEDVFIPLLDRTRIANENNGKVFVSIHANSNPNLNVRGFETYLLRPGKTQDAIEVSTRENAVIKLEELENHYTDLTDEALIMATMAQSVFMKESETLAAMIQDELAQRLESVDRGVKQAGFYVLIGASMPNVLVEIGFLSNSQEERNLRQPAYRQQIAEAIFQAIVKFKTSREMVLAEG